MSVISTIKKWFHKEKNASIINISDVLQIPTREFYNDNPEKIAKIDEYKKEYSKLFSRLKIVTFKELESNDLKDNVMMNINLIIQICTKTEINEPLKQSIDIIKLKMYLSTISDMESETLEKLIALKELQTKRLIHPLNKVTLNGEINHLTNILVILMNQKRAIESMIKAYLLKANSNQTEITNDEINKKHDEVLSLATGIIDVSSIVNSEYTKLLKIAMIERELEIYVYKNHNDELKKLNRELEEITEFEKYELRKHKQSVLNKITQLEKIYKVYDEYGRGYAIDDAMLNLYRIKFDILTCDINIQKESPFKYENTKEYECYEKIVSEKLETILMGKNEYLKEIFIYEYKKAISIIGEALSQESEHRIRIILSEKSSLALLLSFDKPDGLYDFFVQTIIVGGDFWYIDRPWQRFKFANELPLSTLYELYKSDTDSQAYYEKLPLYRLYKLYDSTLSPHYKPIAPVETYLPNHYYIPEGITSIGFNTGHGRSPFKKDADLIQYITNNSKDKTVVTPSTLTEISYHLLDDNIHGLILNEGLRRIGSNAFYNLKLSTINIPSTVEIIERYAFHYKSLKVIEFNNFTKSKILHDKSALKNILRETFYAYDHAHVNPENKKYESAMQPPPSSYEKKYLGDSNSVFVYRKVRNVSIHSNLFAICLSNDNSNSMKVRIDLNDLSIPHQRWGDATIVGKNDLFYNKEYHIYRLNNEELEILIAELQRKIKLETGYDLVFDKEEIKSKKRVRQLH